MRICLHCGSNLEGHANWECAGCGYSPKELGGYTSFAPSLTVAEKVFDRAAYAKLAPLEANNFWFRARNKLILHMMKKYCATAKSVMEVGCGTGFVLGAVAKSLPEAEVVGTEIHWAPLDVARVRAPHATFLQLDATALPYRDHFQVIGAFDVLEHIEEDERVLAQMHVAMAPGGTLLITVPQHPFLWSEHDDAARHVRRYRASELEDKVRIAGFSIVRATSFISLLLPAMMVSRKLAKGRASRGQFSEFDVPSALNRALEIVLDVERSLIQLGLDFPVGGSLFLVARKAH